MNSSNITTRLGLATVGLIISAASYAGDIRDQIDIKTGKVELVVPDLSAQEVTSKVTDAISQWAIPANANVRSLPSTIPTRPDEPVGVQRYISGAPVIEYQCKTAFSEITKKPPPVNNPFMKVVEYTQVCVYPFQKGVKVYVIYNYGKKTESLTSGLFNGITKAIRGDDSEWITKQLKENIEAIRKNIPSLLVEKLEVPGTQVQEPDKEAVAALIPPKPVEAPPAAVPVQPVVAAAQTAIPSPPTAMATKIEARKTLNSMGMVYHSQEQMVAAIRRKDDVAVQLYLDAGAIDLDAKEKNGKSLVDIANDSGAPQIAKMIADRKKATAEPAPATTPAAAPVAAPVPPSAGNASPSPSKQQVDAAAATLPPEMLAKIDAQLASANLTPEQREKARANSILTIANIKALTDRIDPATGQLRAE